MWFFLVESSCLVFWRQNRIYQTTRFYKQKQNNWSLESHKKNTKTTQTNQNKRRWYKPNMFSNCWLNSHRNWMQNFKQDSFRIIQNPNSDLTLENFQFFIPSKSSAHNLSPCFCIFFCLKKSLYEFSFDVSWVSNYWTS